MHVTAARKRELRRAFENKLNNPPPEEQRHKARLLALFAIDPNVAAVIDQPFTAVYANDFGTESHMRFDCITVSQGGVRTAVALKQDDWFGWDAQEADKLTKNKDRMTPVAVDEFVVMTDANLTEDGRYNADLLIAAQEDKGPRPDAILRDVLKTLAGLNGCTSVGDLVRASTFEEAGLLGVVRLIASRELEIVSGARIDHEMIVRPRQTTQTH